MSAVLHSTVAKSAGATAPLRIASIEPIAVSLPMVKPVKMSFEEVRRAENLVVRVETEDGVVGWGEAASAPHRPGS